MSLCGAHKLMGNTFFFLFNMKSRAMQPPHPPPTPLLRALFVPSPNPGPSHCSICSFLKQGLYLFLAIIAGVPDSFHLHLRKNKSLQRKTSSLLQQRPSLLVTTVAPDKGAKFKPIVPLGALANINDLFYPKP
jgi:hypothetical protein